MCYMYTVEYYLAIKKEENPAICDNMGGPWGYYAKWNRQRKTITLWPHLYVESKTNKQAKHP